MSTFLERLIEEEKQVTENLNKLSSYIDTNRHLDSLSTANQILLHKQRDVMAKYSNILITRIELNSK